LLNIIIARPPDATKTEKIFRRKDAQESQVNPQIEKQGVSRKAAKNGNKTNLKYVQFFLCVFARKRGFVRVLAGPFKETE